jgi:hypothetical protein
VRPAFRAALTADARSSYRFSLAIA